MIPGLTRSRVGRSLLLLLILLLSPACLVSRPDPVLKVGLLAPFEGMRRQQGYHLLPAIRAATPDTVQGRRVEWVILDTGGDSALAAQRARELVADPAVLVIVGPLLPDTVEAVAPVVEAAGVSWWPLAPEGRAGLEAWLGQPLAAEQGGWGAAAWPAVRRGELQRYFDPALPADLGGFEAVAGQNPWPQDWLAWQATQAAFGALEGASALDRAAVLPLTEPLLLPPPAEYISSDLGFPGIAQQPP